MGAVVGELSAKFAMESGMDAGGALKLATTMSAAAGALVGGPDSAAAVNVASQMGANCHVRVSATVLLLNFNPCFFKDQPLDAGS